MLEARDIRKAYGGVVALDGVGLTVHPGTVHALLGENGAGKSTLVKAITGAIRPDAGVLRLDGREVAFSSTADAARAGVAVVSQELSLFPDLDVLVNLFPMREPRRGLFVSRAEMARRARPVLDELGLEVSLRAPVGELSLAQRQLVEVAKALVTEPRVLILDEPTSALEPASAEALLSVLRVLRSRRVAVAFVSHILEEVMALCDEVTVLRDGRPVLEGVPRAGLTMPALVAAMVGDERDAVVERPAPADLPARAAGAELRLEGVSVEGRLQEVDLVAAPGEIVGLAGLVGAGHLAVLEVIAGIRRASAGRVDLPGTRRAGRGLRGAIGSGVAIVSGDRRRNGLMLDRPIWENVGQVRAVALAREGIRIRPRGLRERAREHVERLRIRTPSVNERAGQLSGGNQQKVVFAKWLDAAPSVLLLDDPTRGVDIGARAEMHELIRSVAGGGAITLLCSTDIEELVTICDRVVVFRSGRIETSLAGEGLHSRAVLEAMNAGALVAAD